MLFFVFLSLLTPAWVATEAILGGQRRTRAATIEGTLVLSCFVVVPGAMFVLFQAPANPDSEQIATTRGQAAAFVALMVSPWLAAAVILGSGLASLRRRGDDGNGARAPCAVALLLEVSLRMRVN